MRSWRAQEPTANAMDGGTRPSSAEYDVEDGYRHKLRETDAHRLEQRQKGIDKGKNTRAYHNYIKSMPKAIRPVGTSADEEKYPRTPDKFEITSKRGWEGKVKAWRIRLHKWNPAAAEDEEVVEIPGRANRGTRSVRQVTSPTKDGSPSRLQVKKRDRDEEEEPQSAKRKSLGGITGSILPSQIRVSSRDPTFVSPTKANRPQTKLVSVEAAAAKPLPEAAKTIFDDFSDDEDIGL